MEWKINDLGKVGSLTVVGNMEQINEVNDFLKVLANKAENEQSNCNLPHVSNLVCPTHGTMLYKHTNGLAYCSLCTYSVSWQTGC